MLPTPVGTAIGTIVNAAVFMYHGCVLIRSQQLRDQDKPEVWSKPLH